MMEIQKLLRGAEIDAEKVSAVIRLVVFVTLASVIFSANGAEGLAPSIKLTIALYGVGTIVGLVLAWRRVFHPAIPYLFVTFDVILVSAQILLLTGLMGMKPSFVFALPAAGLVFVILIHAAMRFRPWLIVYAAILFLATLNLGNLFLTQDREATMAMPMTRDVGMGSVMNYQVLPVALVALAAFILFVTSRRTRALLLRSITQTNRAATLSRYFSPNLANSLAESDDDQLLAGRRLSAAVLFVDIRGFTALGETMAPEELTSFLSEYRNRLTRPIFDHGGTVDKFIGDAIMAVFGTPTQRPDDAVIGDTVNVAERLEGLSRNVGSPLVVSAALLGAAMGSEVPTTWRRLPPQELKGHRQPVEAYCLAT
jgi:adenylate cyclase